jgi:hypothetical protein
MFVFPCPYGNLHETCVNCKLHLSSSTIDKKRKDEGEMFLHIDKFAFFSSFSIMDPLIVVQKKSHLT